MGEGKRKESTMIGKIDFSKPIKVDGSDVSVKLLDYKSGFGRPMILIGDKVLAYVKRDGGFITNLGTFGKLVNVDKDGRNG